MQVIGVSDTGIDMGSCYFWDPQFRVCVPKQKNAERDALLGRWMGHVAGLEQAWWAPAERRSVRRSMWFVHNHEQAW